MRAVHLMAGLIAGIAVSSAVDAQEMMGRRFSSAPVERVALSGASHTPIFDAVQQQAKIASGDERGRLRVGAVRAVVMPKEGLLWSKSGSTGQVAHFAVRSADALGIRAQLRMAQRSPGMTVRVASAPNGDAISMPLDALTENEFWTPYTEGDTQYIEVFLPSSAQAGQIQVKGAVHFDISPYSVSDAKVAGICSPDVSCTSNDAALDVAIAERKNSVPLLNFMSEGSSYVCTGTLLNSEQYPVPYLITANHCISSQMVASTLTTFWFRESVSCGSVSTNPGTQVASGAQLVFSNFNVDSTLLQLNNPPPDGAVFSGWDAAPLALHDAVVSMSHPRGDPTKFALGSFTTLLRIFDYPQDMYGVSFTRGVIEPGSSGSGVFALASGSLQLRGVLSGTTLRNGGLSCTNLNDYASYGRFEIFYPEVKAILSPSLVGTLTDDYPNQPGPQAPDLPLVTPIPIDPASPAAGVSGNINYAGDLDVFKVTVTQPGTFTVFSSGGMDNVGTLIKPNDTPVSNDDAESRSNDFGITERVDPGIYYVLVGHFLPAGTGAYKLHTSFSTVTDNYSDIWSVPSESGWGLALTHQGNTIAGALYTYDVDGSNMWLLLNGAQKQADGSYLGPLMRYTGPAFYSTPWPTQSVSYVQVGTMRIDFSSTASAQLTYSVDGTTVTKTISRLVYDKQPTCVFSSFDRSFALNYQDVWWNPAESGWGINIVHQGNIVTGGIYTYDATGKALWLLLGATQRQLTATSEIYTGDLSRYTGPAFNASPWPSPATPTKVGTMRLEFTQGNKGIVTYSVNDVQVSRPIQRLVFSSPMTECR